MKLFVTGIHTDIGKTIVSSILVRQLNAAYWKPIQAGGLDCTDADVVKKYNPNATIFPSQYVLKTPASPHFAAQLDGVDIQLEKFDIPNYEPLIVEGAGGLMSPLGNTFTNLDFIKYYNFKCVLVVKDYLGSISHTLSCIKVLENENIECLGIIMVGENKCCTEEFIVQYTNIAILGRIEIVDEISDEFIEKSICKIKL